MAKAPVVITRNYGGLAADLKEGPKYSFAYSRHLDFRKQATVTSILPKTVKESSTTVTGLVTEAIQLPSGKIVAIDSSGGVYTRSTAGSWAKNGTVLTNTAAGMAYNLQHDTIYVPGLTAMHSITNADGRFSGGSFTVNESVFVAQVDQSASSSANTYTTTTSITETSVNMLSFVPAIEPLYSVKIWVTTKGTGDVTVTMHDAANNLLGTVTKTAAQLTNGALNEFVFTSVRMSVVPNASTYHFHVTHDGAGTATTIGTGTASDLSTARYESYSNRFVDPVNDFHPAIDFLQYICIGNERYLAVWEPISQANPTELELEQHRIVFPTGYEVCGLALWNEYLAIACEKRSTSSTNEFQDGRIFFWNGTSTTWDFSVPVPEGAPYGLATERNLLTYIANGAKWGWNGGEPQKIFQLPYTDFEFTDAETYMVNYPHTQAVRNGVALTAFPSETNSTAIQHGVYSFGSRMKNYPDSFGYSYTMSTGTRTNGTLRLGMLKNFGDKMFLSWRDGATYGVDVVDPDSDPFSEATWESLIIDNNRPDKTKQATEMIITFKALPTGCTVTPKYKIDRATNYTSGTAAVAGDTRVRLNINDRYKEIQLAYDLVATTTTPEITGVVFIYDGLAQERD